MTRDEQEPARFSNVYFAYLFDLGLALKELAFEAKEHRDGATAAADRAFETGRLMAFQEVISLMQQNAAGLGIPLSDLHLDDVVPDRDLV
jgi:hypothetical protein